MTTEVDEQNIRSLSLTEEPIKPDDQADTFSNTRISRNVSESVPLYEDGDVLKSISNQSAIGRENVAEGEEGAVETESQLPDLISYIAMLDAPRQLQEPVNITFDYLKQISEELGLIKLCWPDLLDVAFEDRTNFPDSYLKNSNKEKLLLLYAENFRRQFCFQYPDRKPLFLACDNECGMQKMVCTTIRPTTLPYPEMETWEKCVRFVADHLKYEPLEEPVLIRQIANATSEYQSELKELLKIAKQDKITKFFKPLPKPENNN